MIVLSSALFYLQEDFRVPSLVQRLLLKENDKDLHAAILRLYSQNSLTTTHCFHEISFEKRALILLKITSGITCLYVAKLAGITVLLFQHLDRLKIS